MARARKADRFTSYDTSVFINCPFDGDYDPLFQALVFATFACGFRARCAREERDSADIRLNKIMRIVEECRFSIHDISRTQLDSKFQLPRFNMPLELGMCLGARQFGDKRQRRKKVLVFDTEQYRYQKFMSDIAGQDIHPHNGDPFAAVGEIRDWFSQIKRDLPGAEAMKRDYGVFLEALPDLCKRANRRVDELTFNDLTEFVVEWLNQRNTVQV